MNGSAGRRAGARRENLGGEITMADEVLKMVFLTLVAAGMVIAITRRDWLGFAAVCLLVAAGGR